MIGDALKFALLTGAWLAGRDTDYPESTTERESFDGNPVPDPSPAFSQGQIRFSHPDIVFEGLSFGARRFLQEPGRYLAHLLGDDPQTITSENESELALALADEVEFYREELNSFEADLSQFHALDLEQKSRLIEMVLGLGASYMSLAQAPQENTEDLEYSSEALSVLAAESFGILSRFAADDADPALQRLAPFFAGHEALALGEMEEAVRNFNEVKAFIPEAAAVLKRLEGDQLRMQNLALVQAWRVYHREAYEAGFNELHGAVGLMEGIFESQEGTPWYEYFIPFHDPAEQGKHLVRDGTVEFSEMEFYRKWEQKKALVAKVENKIIQNEAKTIREALEQISASETSPQQEQAEILLREKFFSQNLIPGLIQLGDAKVPDPKLANRFLEAAQHLEYGEGFAQFPALAYGLIGDLSSDADTVAMAQNYFTEWQEAQSGEMGFGDSVGRLVHNINPSAAGEFIPLLLAGGIGGMARSGALKALGKSGITGYKAVALAFGAEVLAEGAALGTIMVGQGALHHNIDESLSSEHIIRSYASSLIMIGGLKGIGRIGQASTLPMARGLGLLAADGVQLSRGGQIFAKSLGHLFGMSGMVGVSHVNQWLGLNPAPQGGTWQSLAHDLFMYWEFNLAHKIIDGFTMGRVRRFQGQQHGEAALREAHLMARSHADRLGFKNPSSTLDPALKVTPQGGMAFESLPGSEAPSPARQSLVQQLTQATLTRPGFSAGKFAKLIERGEYQKANAYLKKFHLLRPERFELPKLAPLALGDRHAIKDWFSYLSDYLAKLPPAEHFGLQRILGEGNEYGVEINGETGSFPQAHRKALIQALKKLPGAKVMPGSHRQEILLSLKDPITGKKRWLSLEGILEGSEVVESKPAFTWTEKLLSPVAAAVPGAPLSIFATFASLAHLVRRSQGKVSSEELLGEWQRPEAQDKKRSPKKSSKKSAKSPQAPGPKRMEYRWSESPAGLVIRPRQGTRIQTLAETFIAGKKNQIARHNQRIVINIQSWEGEFKASRGLKKALQHLAERSGVTICLKTRQGAEEFMPTAETKRLEKKGPWKAMGRKEDHVSNAIDDAIISLNLLEIYELAEAHSRGEPGAGLELRQFNLSSWSTLLGSPDAKPSSIQEIHRDLAFSPEVLLPLLENQNAQALELAIAFARFPRRGLQFLLLPKFRVLPEVRKVLKNLPLNLTFELLDTLLPQDSIHPTPNQKPNIRKTDLIQCTAFFLGGLVAAGNLAAGRKWGEYSAQIPELLNELVQIAQEGFSPALLEAINAAIEAGAAFPVAILGSKRSNPSVEKLIREVSIARLAERAQRDFLALWELIMLAEMGNYSAHQAAERLSLPVLEKRFVEQSDWVDDLHQVAPVLSFLIKVKAKALNEISPENFKYFSPFLILALSAYRRDQPLREGEIGPKVIPDLIETGKLGFKPAIQALWYLAQNGNSNAMQALSQFEDSLLDLYRFDISERYEEHSYTLTPETQCPLQNYLPSAVSRLAEDAEQGNWESYLSLLKLAESDNKNAGEALQEIGIPAVAEDGRVYEMFYSYENSQNLPVYLAKPRPGKSSHEWELVDPSPFEKKPPLHLRASFPVPVLASSPIPFMVIPSIG